MAERQQSPLDEPTPINVGADMMNRLLEAKAENPSLFRELSTDRWTHLSPAERDLLTATAVDAYPHDIAARQVFIDQSLVRDYIRDQIEQAEELNALFALGSTAVNAADSDSNAA